MNKTSVELSHLFDELRDSNKLKILSLTAAGVQQKDIAAALGISPSSLSLMFPKGVLKNVALSTKSKKVLED